MSDCDELLAAFHAAKQARNQAHIENAQALDAGEPAPHSEAEIMALMHAVDVAAQDARDAGCEEPDPPSVAAQT